MNLKKNALVPTNPKKLHIKQCNLSAQFQQWYWVQPNKRRYYQAILIRDLLGDRVLAKAWGSLDSKRGGQDTSVLSSPEEEENAIDALLKRRKQHHYILITYSNSGENDSCPT